ncbi:MAG: hypothetical protein H6R01_1400 [Burkholderiaceae bacterium]|nr:hypothetical protein [Burkholderiaceae bacterium]
MHSSDKLHIFCRVIDNFGDAGVCWRLARQLAHEHHVEVTLWIDELGSLKRMCAELDASANMQSARGVTVRRWPSDDTAFTPADTADAVIEAFACELPTAYMQAMAKREKTPAWLNLEYLSAEEWVEGCHALPSPHPSLPLSKYFFFPGFTERTGGLLRERNLFTQRDSLQNDLVARAAFFSQLGVQLPLSATAVSLFCYPQAPLNTLFEAMQDDGHPVVCVAPESVATDAIGQFLQQAPIAGASATRGALTVQVLPFLDQDDYDRLLWACDLNFIRGEDSLVRAQWAARPFIWHIYAQDENAHVIKLDAFLGKYTERMPPADALTATRFHLAWNGIRDTGSIASQWRDLRAALPDITQHGRQWAQQLSHQDDLATALMGFLRKIG